MSELATAVQWRVRGAVARDIDGVGIAVEELLLELGGKPPFAVALRDTIRELIDDPQLGALLVAESADGSIVGFLGASWQTAVRIPGRYGLIQELWVRPDWRSRDVGAGLLAALSELAQERGIARIEVGLPSERFAELGATEAFYARNGFEPIGMRMRLLLG
jgi:GNAT superfamily N-acetyltransferase